MNYRLQLFALPECSFKFAHLFYWHYGTVEAVIHVTLVGRMLILCRIIKQTRPAEKQQCYNQMKTISHLFRLFDSKVLCSHCVFIEVHRQPQFPYTGDTVTDSSLKPSVALISAPQWHHTLHSELSWIHRVTEMVPVKADLAICSPAIGVPR